MMINKRLIATVAESQKYIAGNVASQWVSLCSNVVIMGSIATFVGKLAYAKPFWTKQPQMLTLKTKKSLLKRLTLLQRKKQ